MDNKITSSGDEMFLQNAKSVFIHRDIQCWTKGVKQVGPWFGTHCGYFRMMIPGVNGQDDLTNLFITNGGEKSLPNGGRFTYLVKLLDGGVIAGFDGMHPHNATAPLGNDDAMHQLRRAVDFLLDNGLGRLAYIPMQA